MRFKAGLHIGEDAYALLRARRTLWEAWDTAGIAVTGATVAASSTVATTFFASTASGGLLGLIGLGTAAATPVGWVAAAAAASGVAYHGLRYRKGGPSAFVDVIPKFLNTPVDQLAFRLFDLIAGLAVRLAAIDGQVHPSERDRIAEHFVADWGFDPEFVARALPVIEANAETLRVVPLAQALTAFLHANPDCNPAPMCAAVLALLHAVAAADGVDDEREGLALGAIARVFDEANGMLAQARRELSSLSAAAGEAATSVGGRIWAAAERLRPS